MPRAVVVLTGSELVRGDKADANGAFLARELTRIGLAPSRMLVVGDDPDELDRAVAEALSADVAVFSGGLGPTHDDRTVETIARLAGRELVVDEALAEEIDAVARGIAERIGRPYADFVPGVRKQASIPAGGTALGLAGTAPAVLLEHDGRVAVALPGPPSELRRLWPRVLEAPALRVILDGVEVPEHRLLRFFGPSESAVARVLEEVGGEGDGLEVTICAHDFEIRVDMFSGAGGDGRAEHLHRSLEEHFAADVFAADERTVAELVLDRCRELGLTLATAESCTGGMVAARLTDVAGASDVFVGSVVAYSNDVKMQRLGVPPDVLERHGAVSEETAAGMAAGAREALGADVALSVTGVAGPDGGSAEKPVGLVYIHAEAPSGSTKHRVVVPGDREAVRARATALRSPRSAAPSVTFRDRHACFLRVAWRHMSAFASSSPCGFPTRPWSGSSRGNSPSSPERAMPASCPRGTSTSPWPSWGRGPRPTSSPSSASCASSLRRPSGRCSPAASIARRGASGWCAWKTTGDARPGWRPAWGRSSKASASTSASDERGFRT